MNSAPTMVSHNDISKGRLSGLIENHDHFAIQAVLEKTETGLRLVTLRWPKLEFDGWWQVAQLEVARRFHRLFGAWKQLRTWRET